MSQKSGYTIPVLGLIPSISFLLTAFVSTAFGQFEQNLGQSAPSTSFLLNNQGILLRATESGLEFQAPGALPLRLSVRSGQGKWTGEQPQASTVSYFIGSNPTHWVHNAPIYHRLRRANILPGIDWIIYLNNGNIEYDFELSDASLLTSLVLEWSGNTPTLLNHSFGATLGALHFTQHQPRFFAAKTELAGGLQQLTPHTFCFRLQQPPPPGPLRIDPIVEVSGSFGGPGDDTVLTANDSFSVGITRSAAWDRSPTGSGADIFIRTHFSGNRYSTTYFGGTGDDFLFAASDSGASTLDQVIAVGSTNSRDLPAFAIYGASSAAQVLPATLPYGGGSSDALILNISGTSLSARIFGGPDAERFNAIHVATNTTYFGGEVASALSPTPQGLLAYTVGNRVDSIRVPVPIRSITLDAGSNTVFVAGDSDRDDLQNLNSSWSQRAGSRDVWLAALRHRPSFLESPTMLWQGLWGGPADESVAALQLLPPIGLVLTGNTNSNNINHRNPAQPMYGGGDSDIFLLALDTAGRDIQFSTYLGGNGNDRVLTASSILGSLFLAGSTDSSDLPLPGPSLQRDLSSLSQGSTDGFAAQISTTGSMDWGIRVGGEGEDRIRSIRSQSGAIWLAGESNRPAWLSSLNPYLTLLPNPGSSDDPERHGFDTFALRFRANIVNLGPILVGQNLRVGVPIAASFEKDFDGVLEVISADPTRLLISSPTSRLGNVPDPPAARIVLTEVDLLRWQGAGFFLEALGEPGPAEIIIRAANMVERRFPVTIAPSALYSRSLSRIQALNSIQTYSAALAPLAAPGSTPVFQAPRFGLNPRIDFVSSDPDALVPVMLPNSSNNSGTEFQQSFELRKPGTYQLQPRSPLFPTAPHQAFTISDTALDTGVSSSPATTLLLPQGLVASFSLPTGRPPTRIEVSVEDPTLLLVSSNANQRGRSSIIIDSTTNQVFLQTLAGSGLTRLRFSSPTGWSFTQELRCVPTRLRLTTSASVAPRGEEFTITVNLDPDYSGLAPNEGPSATAIPAALAPFPFIPLLSQQFELAPTTPGSASLILGQFTFTGYRATYTLLTTGETAFRLNMAFPLLRPSQNSVSVTVRPPAFVLSVPEVVLPQSGMMALPVAAFLPRMASSRVRATFLNPAVAELRQFGLASPATFNLSNTDSFVQVAAKGPPGSSTLLTLVADDVRIEIPIRIVPLVLVAVSEEVRISQVGSVPFAITGRDGNTFLPLGIFVLADFAEFAVTNSNPTACPIPERVRLSSLNQWTVECKAPGLADIRLQPIGAVASATGATFRIRSGIDPLTNITPLSILGSSASPRVILGSGLSTPYPFLSLNWFGDEVDVESLDPDLVTISRDSTTPGVPRLRLAPSSSIQSSIVVHASNRTGTTFLRFSGSGGRVREIPVFVWSSSLVFTGFTDGLRDQPRLSIPFSGSEPRRQQLGISPLPIDPITKLPFFSSPSQYFISPAANPQLIQVTSSNPEVAEPTTPTPVFGPPLSSQVPGLFTALLKARGTSTLEITQPEGFSPSPLSRLVVETSTPRLFLNASPILGPGLQVQSGIGFTDANTSSNLTVTISSTNPEVILLAESPTGPALPQLTRRNLQTLFIRCLREGAASLRLEAEGYESATAPILIAPIQLVWLSGLSPTLLPGQVQFLEAGIDFQNTSDRLTRQTLWLNPDAPYQFELQSSGPAQFQFPDGPKAMNSSGTPRFSTRVIPVTIGESTFSFTATGDPIAVPEPRLLRVTPWPIQTNRNINIGRGLMVTPTIRNERSQPVTYRIVPQGGITVGADIASLSTNPLNLTVPANREIRYFLAAPLQEAPGRLLWSEPESINLETTVSLERTLFQFSADRFPGFIFNQSLDRVELPIALSASGSFFPSLNLNPLLGPQTLRLSSSNPQVASFASNTLIFPASASQTWVDLRLNSPGTTILSMEAPPGFSPTTRQEILITVR